jgi:hypothetical protein
MHIDRTADFAQLARIGIHLPGYRGYHEDLLAMDSQQPLVTTSSSGIPAYLANYIDPKFIEVLTAPNKAAQIYGETKMGDWTKATLTFPAVEYTGEVSSYGDYSEAGSIGVNATFPQRQPYHYQTITQWGERQLEVADLAKLDYASRMNVASANILNKFQNDTYFYGVAGLQNYGALNDPALPSPITPGNKAFNSNAPGPWVTNGAVTATANEIFSDIQSLFGQAIAQTNNLIDSDAKMTLAMSPGSDVALATTNQFNVNVNDMIRKNFPNMTVKTAPQLATAAGNLVQLIVEDINGEQVIECIFTEKMRAHAIIRGHSSYSQKKSQGSAGAMIYRPFGIAQLLGV